MAVTDFETKVAVVVRDDLAAWQRLNVTAFLISGIMAGGAEVGPAARDLRFAIYTAELFSTGHDEANRAAVRAVRSAELDLVGVGLRAPHKAADGVLRGLRRHP